MQIPYSTPKQERFITEDNTTKERSNISQIKFHLRFTDVPRSVGQTDYADTMAAPQLDNVSRHLMELGEGELVHRGCIHSIDRHRLCRNHV